MNDPIPDANWQTGWPHVLEDIDGEVYHLLRDGQPTGESGGHSCLYGRLTHQGYIQRDRQWIPQLGSTREEVRMAGGVWMSPQEFVNLGLPPITIPPEPVIL